MKGWKLNNPLELSEEVLTEQTSSESSTKIKIIKALITLPDVLRFTGDIDSKKVVPGSYGIGIVSETSANFFDLVKGKHVYIEPARPCGNCYNCNKYV